MATKIRFVRIGGPTLQVLRISLCIFVLGITCVCTGQNLVPNASFEQLSSCPQNATPDKLNILTGWGQPGEGTPDVFNTCSERLCQPFNNFAGSQKPFEGQGYAGFIAYSNQAKTYREYLQAPLNHQLETGKKYEIVLHVSLSDHSGYAVSNIGCAFSPTPFNTETTFALHPASILESDTLIKDTSGWVQLRFEHTATGNEHYFLIGNFRKFHEIKKIVQVQPAKKAVNNVDAYYYVDGVSVQESNKTPGQEEEAVAEYFTNDSTMVLSNLEFGYDSYALSEKDMDLLKKVAAYFEKRPQYCLMIEGHTDAMGNYSYNMDLSVKRAESVQVFLRENGIAASKLSSEGFGFTRPIDRNLKSQRNRRVEISLKKCSTGQ